MIGVRGVRAALSARLSDRINEKVTELSVRESLTARSKPGTVRVFTRDPGKLGLDKLPAVAVIPEGTSTERGPVRMAAGAFTEEYEYTYRMWVYGWVKGPTTDDTDDRRDVLALAVREVLLQGRALTEHIIIDPNTYLEEYDDVTSQAQTAVAGFRVTLDYRVTEYLDTLAGRTPNAQIATSIGVTP